MVYSFSFSCADPFGFTDVIASQFSILNSQFSILNSPFSIPSSIPLEVLKKAVPAPGLVAVFFAEQKLRSGGNFPKGVIGKGSAFLANGMHLRDKFGVGHERGNGTEWFSGIIHVFSTDDRPLEGLPGEARMATLEDVFFKLTGRSLVE